LWVTRKSPPVKPFWQFWLKNSHGFSVFFNNFKTICKNNIFTLIVFVYFYIIFNHFYSQTDIILNIINRRVFLNLVSDYLKPSACLSAPIIRLRMITTSAGLGLVSLRKGGGQDLFRTPRAFALGKRSTEYLVKSGKFREVELSHGRTSKWWWPSLWG